jgi:hypothetical protein
MFEAYVTVSSLTAADVLGLSLLVYKVQTGRAGLINSGTKGGQQGNTQIGYMPTVTKRYDLQLLRTFEGAVTGGHCHVRRE